MRHSNQYIEQWKNTSAKGITLIALIITVIIMLILASITIQYTIGNGGLITKANEAKERYEQASKNEQEELANIWEELNKEPPTPPRDEAPPTVAITISGETTQANLPIHLSANVKLEDKESGVKLDACKYVINTESGKIGLEEENYTSGTFVAEQQIIPMELDLVTDWYLHILATDQGGNKKETITGPIVVKDVHHIHKDVNEESQQQSYKAPTSGGCFTKQEHTYQTILTRCTGIYTILRTSDGNHPGSKGSYDCNKYCGYYGNKDERCDNPSRPQQIVTGTYYTLSCGKTEETVERYDIEY